MRYEPLMTKNSPGTLVWKRGWGFTTIHFTYDKTDRYLHLAHARTQQSARVGSIGTVVVPALATVALVIALMWVVLGLLGVAPDWTLPLAYAIPGGMLVVCAIIWWVSQGRDGEAFDADSEHRRQMVALVAATLVMPQEEADTTKRALDRIDDATAREIISLIEGGSANIAERAVKTLIESEHAQDLQVAAEADRSAQEKADAIVARAHDTQADGEPS